MIREFREADSEQVLTVWLAASIRAHDFIEPEFWHAKVSDMRDIYLPASETYVFDAGGKIAGFYSLSGDCLAALFVAPESQGTGIGTVLIDDAKRRRQRLQLTVYRENVPSVQFYEKRGFILVGEHIDEHTGHPELAMASHP